MKADSLSYYSNVMVSVFSLSLGNSFLNEDTEIVESMNSWLYWLLMIIEYISVYIIMLNIIYVVVGNKFIKTNKVTAKKEDKEFKKQDLTVTLFLIFSFLIFIINTFI